MKEIRPGESSAKTEATYPTTDLDLAAFLLCRGITPTKVRPPLPHSFPRFVTFFYLDTSALQNALDDWSCGQPLPVDLHEFLENRLNLYRRVRALREGGQ